MEASLARKKGRKKKKSLLLHYDKHENNFPPIFSIKIIAFFAFYSLALILGETRQGFAAAAADVVGVACLKLKSAVSVLETLERSMEMKHSERAQISAFLSNF